MHQKLTLRVNSNIITKAKEYADTHNTSISKLVELYFYLLSQKKHRDDNISPAIREISGVIKLPKGFDYKKERQKDLLKKYLANKNG